MAALDIRTALENAKKSIDRQLDFLDYDPDDCIVFLQRLVRHCHNQAFNVSKGVMVKRKEKTRHE